MSRSAQLKDQVEQIWRGALSEVRTQTTKTAQKVQGEVSRLAKERDQLLARLGEQTLAWVNANAAAVPGPLRATVAKINRMVENLIEVPRYSVTSTGAPPQAANSRTVAVKAETMVDHSLSIATENAPAVQSAKKSRAGVKTAPKEVSSQGSSQRSAKRSSVAVKKKKTAKSIPRSKSMHLSE